MNIIKIINIILLLGTTTVVQAQKTWTVDECMNYAVKQNRTVRQQTYSLDTYKSNKVKAIGGFLPEVKGYVSGQYNFGRAVDPETNTYTNVNTFYNGYSLEASIPLFNGLQNINNLRAAKADILMGKNALQAAKDNTALATFQSYIDALYYTGAVKMAKEKRNESELMLKQTRVMEEVGRKGPADVAQMEAQYATDDYDVTRQQNLLATALLTLKQQMNFPMDSTLQPDSMILENITLSPRLESAHDIFTVADNTNPTIQEAKYAVLSACHSLRSARGAYSPTISFGAGISTSYYKTLHNHEAESFKSQFSNNQGEYVALSLTIPIFNQLSTISNVRRSKNDYNIAQEKYEEAREELRKLVEQAIMDREGYMKESIQMEKKTMSDSIAYQLTRRQYEEGLTGPIEVQTSAATLVKSKATLLQSKLLYILKDRLVDYYKGKPLYNEQ